MTTRTLSDRNRIGPRNEAETKKLTIPVTPLQARTICDTYKAGDQTDLRRIREHDVRVRNFLEGRRDITPTRDHILFEVAVDYLYGPEATL